MKKYRPEEFTAMCREYYPLIPTMTFEEAIQFLEKELLYDEHTKWSIRYYGFGEHFTFWPGDGTFIDFGVDDDTPITWDKMKQIIIESAMARKDFRNKMNDVINNEKSI